MKYSAPNQCIYQSVCIVPFSVDFALQFSNKKLLALYLQNQMSNCMHMFKILPNSKPGYVKLEMSSLQNLRISCHPQNSPAENIKEHRLCVLVKLGPTVSERGIKSELLGCESDSKCKQAINALEYRISVARQPHRILNSM